MMVFYTGCVLCGWRSRPVFTQAKFPSFLGVPLCPGCGASECHLRVYIGAYGNSADALVRRFVSGGGAGPPSRWL
jgi:hypothetical protein